MNDMHVLVPITVETTTVLYYFIENCSSQTFLDSEYFIQDGVIITPFLLYYSFSGKDILEFDQKLDEHLFNYKQRGNFAEKFLGIHSDNISFDDIDLLPDDIKQKLYIASDNDDVLKDTIFVNILDNKDYVFNSKGPKRYDDLSVVS